MAFVLRDFQQLATTPGSFGLWAYRTTDTIEDMMAAGYFNGAASLARIGDRIAVFSTGGKSNTSADLAVHYRTQNTVKVALLASVR